MKPPLMKLNSMGIIATNQQATNLGAMLTN
jgi:hypothetical protein